MKKKRSRKSLSKSKSKPLGLLASKKSAAKKFATKKKRQIPGYQATAPARPRGNFRVKVQGKRKKMKSHQDLPVMRGENLWWKTPELSNLFSVDVVVSSQPASWLASKQANNLVRAFELTLALYFFPFLNMTQPNIVEGDYTGIDYGTVDDTQTQASFATGGPPEVILFTPCLYILNCFEWTRRSVLWEMFSWEKGRRPRK